MRPTILPSSWKSPASSSRRHAPEDALGIYRALAGRADPPWAALEGAGRTAFALGMYRLAGDYLTRAVSSPVAAGFPENQRATDREMLGDSRTMSSICIPASISHRAPAPSACSRSGRLRGRGSPPAPAPFLPRHRHWPVWFPDGICCHPRLLFAGLEQKPDLEQTILQLAYDTETTTTQVCGAPTGDDALLLRIARNPAAVEQE